MVLVTPEQIAEVMSLKPVPHSFAELDEMVSAGLPKTALRGTVNKIFDRPEERRELLHSIVPEATFKRRAYALTAEESARAERLARVYATASWVWDSEVDGRAFLTTEHTLLEGEKPIDVAATELGARRVEEVLWKLFYGLPA